MKRKIIYYVCRGRGEGGRGEGGRGEGGGRGRWEANIHTDRNGKDPGEEVANLLQLIFFKILHCCVSLKMLHITS